MDSCKNNSARIKEEALNLGFSGCGFSQACSLPENADLLNQWINKGYHAELSYMTENAYKRSDPGLLVPNAKSVISVILNYYPKELQPQDLPQFAKYAYGKDYHLVIKEKLNKLLEFINTNIFKTGGRAFVDSAPVFEKAWAARAGLGWIGKHSVLINKLYGSWVFIGELIIDIELEYDSPVEELCGNCTLCIDACPTKAIMAPYKVDCNRCISYHTIEQKSELPDSLKGKMHNYIFGCDICQNVCPWNKKPVTTNEEKFLNVSPLLALNAEEIQKLDDNQIQKYIKGTAMERTKVKGLRRNLEFLSE